MRLSVRARVHGSVFFHFLMVFIVTGFTLLGLLVGFFHTMKTSQTDNPFEKNMKNYFKYIIRDIGDPPDPEKARAIAKAMHLKIRYESQDQKWTTSKSLPSLQTVNSKRFSAQVHGPFIILPSGAGGNYLIAMDFHPEMKLREEVHFSVLLFCLGMVLFGVWFWVRWILKPLRWLTEGVNRIGEGNLDHQVPIRHRDELGRLAESLNSMAKRIRDMLHAKEQLLVDVSHETRTPLTRIKLALAMMPESKQKASIQEDVLELEKMIDEILESRRLQSPHGALHCEPVDLGQLVKRVAAAYRQRKPGVVMLKGSEGGVAHIDSERITKVLHNVLENALKYSGSRGKPVTMEIREASQYWVIVIQDQGMGIPEKDLPFVFEPFYRIDSSRSKETGGYGLGLAICKQIMEAHKGQILISSQVQHGTMVELHFPKQLSA